jgi:outer membrane protein TolC
VFLKGISYSFLSLLIFVNEAWAANRIDIQSAIAEAMGRNPYYQRLQSAAEEASWKPWGALSGHIPKLSVMATHNFDLKYQVFNFNFNGSTLIVPGVYPISLLDLHAEWTVFDGLQTLSAYSAANRAAEAAHLELSYGALKVEEEVRLRFYKAIAALALAGVAQQNLTTLQDHLDRMQVRLKGGSATRFDILRIKVQLEEAYPEKLSADDNVILTREALSEAMGLEKDDRLLNGPLPIPDERSLLGEGKLEIAKRADVQALNKKAEAADKEYLASLGSWFPKVTLVADKQYYNNASYGLTDPYSDAYSVGVLLTWNLFDGGESIARQRESFHRGAQAEAMARAAVLKAPVEVETWRRRFLYNVSLYRARVRAIEAAEESVRLAKLGQDAGTRTNSDVLDAELDLFRARAGTVKAQLDAAEALINLELSLGRKI